jgi:hypothetical protein
MRPFPLAGCLGVLAVLLAADSPGQAAWNNVFQVSCFHHRRTTTSGYCCPAPVPVVAQASPCCPQTCCTTQYVQRSYYQPVTCYQQKTFYEPVTTYQTSYYYEAVTSYRYSCYFDPCTCSYQQVATPTTCYQLRSRCNPVTSYLQRCQMVPVTSYRLSYYYEPVTSCSTTPCCNAGGAPAVAAPALAAPGAAPPGVGEQQQQLQPRPGVGENPGGGSRDSFFPSRETQPPPMNGAEGSSFRQPRLGVPGSPPAAPANQPKVHIDRIAYLPDHNVAGQIVRAEDRAPKAGARLLFVNADRDGDQQSVTSDGQGRFQTTLAKGTWLVYVRNQEGTPAFQKRLEIRESGNSEMQLTSR